MTLKIEELLTQADNVTAKISQLKFAEYNPRKKLQPNDPEYQHIMKSITTYGIVEEVIINDDYTIINGHQRVQIYKDIGLKEIPCKMLHLDKKMERAANLMFNKAQGLFDYDKVAENLADLIENDIATELTGFSDEEVDSLLASLEKSDGNGEKDDESGSGSEEKTKLKSLYLAVGKTRIPISSEERDLMVTLIQEYIDKYDSPVGFCTWIAGNLNSRP